MISKRTLINLVLISMLFISACGKSAEVQAVKIVMSMPTDLGFTKSMIDAANLALNETDGKAGDITVELSILNSTEGDHISEDLEKANAQKAIDDPAVVAYIGPLGSSHAKLVIPLLNRASMAQISATSTWPGLTKPGYGAGEPGIYYPTGQQTYFRTISSDELQGAAAARWAAQLGYKSAYLIYSANTFGEGIAGVFQVTAQDEGIEVVGKNIFDPDVELTSEELQILAQKAIEANPDVIYVGGGFAGNGEYVARALKEQDPEVAIIVPGDLAIPEFIEFLGADLSKDIYGTTVALPVDQLGEPAEKFIAAYQAAYGTMPSPFDAAMYEAVKVAIYAIEHAKEPTREGVLEEMQNLGDYSGVFGTWHFDEQGDISVTGISGTQVQDGTWTFVKALK